MVKDTLRYKGVILRGQRKPESDAPGQIHTPEKRPESDVPGQIHTGDFTLRFSPRRLRVLDYPYDKPLGCSRTSTFLPTTPSSSSRFASAANMRIACTAPPISPRILLPMMPCSCLSPPPIPVGRKHPCILPGEVQHVKGSVRQFLWSPWGGPKCDRVRAAIPFEPLGRPRV